MPPLAKPQRRNVLRAAVTLVVVLPLALGPGASSATADPAIPRAPGPIGGPRLTGDGVIVDRSAGPLPPTPARTWVVADAASGAVLAARGPHQLARPASTLKTLLALTMSPRLDKSSKYVATRADTNVIGSKVGLVAGRKYVVNDLFYALFLKSGNDAANALAHAGAGGSMKRALGLMRAEARRLQARDTTVVNPNGLDEPGQFSSAYDLALWGRAAVVRPDMRRYTSVSSALFPGKRTAGQTQKRIYNTNRLLGTYPGAFGIKTGYTSLARNTLIAAATRGGRTIIVTLTGSQGATAPQAARLLDWGFANGLARPVGQLVNPIRTTMPASGYDRDLALVPILRAPLLRTQRRIGRGRRSPRI